MTSSKDRSAAVASGGWATVLAWLTFSCLASVWSCGGDLSPFFRDDESFESTDREREQDLAVQLLWRSALCLVFLRRSPYFPDCRPRVCSTVLQPFLLAGGDVEIRLRACFQLFLLPLQCRVPVLLLRALRPR